jgi:hypothetical protein
MNKTILTLLIAVIMSSTFSSCMTTKTVVGQYQEVPGREDTYDRGKQFWLFWGIVPLGRTSVRAPADGNCEVITRFNVGDILISGLTGGIITSYSIKVKAKGKN